MNIFVLNLGSSSIKAYVYRFDHLPSEPIAPIWESHVTWKNSLEGEGALEQLLGKLGDLRIDLVGHRIVHGGRTFRESVVIDPQVLEGLRALSELDPLHMTPEIEGIEILRRHFGNITQIAVFDSAFHHTLPKEAALYPGPYKWFEGGIQRFGFHGISFQYCSKRCRALFGENQKMVIAHLGSGASLCAVKEGKSIDTTMGFTPLDGLMMDTRCGSIDPGIMLYLSKRENDLSKVLYEESGLLGVSGLSSDMRDIIQSEHPRAQLALETYLHRLKSCIGSMIASLEGLDLLVFTAGIGENSPLIRERVCRSLSFLGLEIDAKKNTSSDCLISTPDSKVKVAVIHTQEAFEIAIECWQKKGKEIQSNA